MVHLAASYGNAEAWRVWGSGVEGGRRKTAPLPMWRSIDIAIMLHNAYEDLTDSEQSVEAIIAGHKGFRIPL